MAERKDIRPLANVLILVIITSILIYPVYKLVIHFEDHNFDGDSNSSKTGKQWFYVFLKSFIKFKDQSYLCVDLEYL